MDFYILLGLERAASVGDIKRAYKRLARQYHPDINPGDRLAAAQFRQIAEAYETLSDPDRRRRYDATGSAIPPAEPSPFGFEGFDFSVSVSGSAASTFGDLFADVLDQRDARRHEGTPERGAISIRRSRSRSKRRSAAAAPVDGHAAGALPHLPRRGLAAGRRDAVPVVPGRRDGQIGARAHGVLENLRAVRRHRASAQVALSGLCGAAGRDAHRAAHAERPGGPGRRRPDPGARQGPRRPQRRRERRSLHHGPRRAASAVSSRRRRSARHDADCGARGGARREDRGAVARRPGAAARAARHAVGPAVPAARARRPVSRATAAAAISSSK